MGNNGIIYPNSTYTSEMYKTRGKTGISKIHMLWNLHQTFSERDQHYDMGVLVLGGREQNDEKVYSISQKNKEINPRCLFLETLNL